MTQISERPVRSARESGAPRATATAPTVQHGLEDDLADLRLVLAHHRFPTHQDDLLALLLARHEPMRLAWRVSGLSRTRTYHSLDEVCDDLRRGVATT